MSVKDDLERLARVFQERGYLVICCWDYWVLRNPGHIVPSIEVQCAGVGCNVPFLIESETTADDYIEQRRMA